MSPKQQKQLIEIRKRKQELLLEIQVSKDNSVFMSMNNIFFVAFNNVNRLVCCVYENSLASNLK